MVICTAPDRDDSRQCAAVEAKCLLTAWTEEQIYNRSEFFHYLYAKNDGAVVGICSYYELSDEIQLINLAVLPEYRKSGIATELMNTVLENKKDIFLEVSDENPNAISFYKKHGFKAVGRRKGFYAGVDAVVMRRSILQ